MEEEGGRNGRYGDGHDERLFSSLKSGLAGSTDSRIVKWFKFKFADQR